MRIVTWNCNGGFRKKFGKLNNLDADIIIVQECEDPAASLDKNYVEWAKNYFWVGRNKNKGIGIFAKNEIELDKLDWDSNDLRYFISCRVNKKINLIGVWCANSSTFAYIGQFWKYLQLHKSKLEECIIAGDFNSNSIWDKRNRLWNHTNVVKELKEINIESLYHLKNKKENQGEELNPTFFLQRNLNKSYHIDYIFASGSFQKTFNEFSIGHHSDWLELSDHMPILCEI